MFNRHASESAETRVRGTHDASGPLPNVALFVDFEALQSTFTLSAGARVEAAALAQRLISYGRAEGRVVLAKAYGDWTKLGREANELSQNKIEPVLALSTDAERGLSGIELALDAYEALHRETPIDLFVIASGDGKLLPLCRKLREAGAEILVAAPREGTGKMLSQAADKVRWLDDLFQKWPDEDKPLEMEEYEWGPFVRLLNDLEENLEFVGLNYLIRRVLDRGNCGYSELGQKQEVINAAQEMGIIEVYQVENKDHRGDPVSACRLLLENDMVDELLAEQVTEGVAVE